MKLFPSNLATVSNYEDDWKGIWIDSFGDSITAQMLWQPKIYSVLECSFLYYGIGGTKVAGSNADSYWQDVRINALNKSAKFVLILGGANDFSQNIKLGGINSLDVSEFNGALNIMIDKLLQYWNYKKIILITPTYNERDFTPDPAINDEGLSCFDYAQATKLMADKHSLYYVDAFEDMGVDSTNILDYTQDRVHPNDAGAKLLADSVVKKLKTINPNE